jgi:hypothetical protein
LAQGNTGAILTESSLIPVHAHSLNSASGDAPVTIGRQCPAQKWIQTYKGKAKVKHHNSMVQSAAATGAFSLHIIS